MSARGIHHVGVAVGDLDAAVDTYVRLFGAEIEGTERMDDQGVDAVALLLGPQGRIELLTPLADDTPVGRFLAKRGEGMHHVAYHVEDIDEELRRLRSEGATLIDEAPRQGLYGQVAFIHPESVLGVLTELVESEGAS
jgi:methylmalonyl-CoA epimerase